MDDERVQFLCERSSVMVVTSSCVDCVARYIDASISCTMNEVPPTLSTEISRPQACAAYGV
jgi:hypothetical protein